jgi:transposase
MSVRYRVTLTQEERDYLEDITKRGKHSAQKFTHANALLLCDTSDNRVKLTVKAVADAVGVTCRTIEHLKQRFVEEGVESALTRKPASKPPREIRLDGVFEAKLIALACSGTPAGNCRWTVRLLADKAVELQFTESVSKSSVSKILKKTNLSLI